MENSPLNKAHYYARKAESCLKLNGVEKFEALSYLDKCIESLEQSLNLTKSLKAIESIKLQRNHHIKHRDLIQQQYKKIEKQKLDSTVSLHLNERVINSNKIQLDLFENIAATDTLLEEMKKSNPDLETAETLQKMNSELNVLLYQLITQLDETVQENDIFKEKLKVLETKASDKKGEFRRKESIQDEMQEEFAPLELPVFDLESLETPKH